MKKKILFVYDMKLGTPWKDGLWAALNLLEKDFEIIKENLATRWEGHPDEEYNFVLGWGAFDSAVDKWLITLPFKKGLCIAGTTNPPNSTAKNYDILFYETEWQKENQLKAYSKTIHAFGVNADIFHRRTSTYPIWDYIGVGAFSPWKRWNYMLKKEGRRLVVGHYQEDNLFESNAIVQELIKGDVMISNEIDAENLADLYHHSKICYVPNALINGGERAVLEARACGLPVEVEEDNPKLQTLLTTPIFDHHYYYEQLKKGIEAVL